MGVGIEEVGLHRNSIRRGKDIKDGECLLVTYHNAHARELDGSVAEQEAADQLPARLALVLAAGHDDEEGDQGGELDDGGEGDEEAAAAPHGAEELVVAAVFIVREGSAGRVVDRGAALVQADGLLESRARVGGDRIRHPVRRQNRHDRQDRCCGVELVLAYWYYVMTRGSHACSSALLLSSSTKLGIGS